MQFLHWQGGKDDDFKDKDLLGKKEPILCSFMKAWPIKKRMLF